MINLLKKGAVGLGKTLQYSGSAIKTLRNIGSGVNRTISTYKPIIDAGISAAGIGAAPETAGISAGVSSGLTGAVDFLGSQQFGNIANRGSVLGQGLNSLGTKIAQFGHS